MQASVPAAAHQAPRGALVMRNIDLAFPYKALSASRAIHLFHLPLSDRGLSGWIYSAVRARVHAVCLRQAASRLAALAVSAEGP